jgi:hypothetical protein
VAGFALNFAKFSALANCNWECRARNATPYAGVAEIWVEN